MPPELALRPEYPLADMRYRRTAARNRGFHPEHGSEANVGDLSGGIQGVQSMNQNQNQQNQGGQQGGGQQGGQQQKPGQQQQNPGQGGQQQGGQNKPGQSGQQNR
jgi:hypothetical protein